MARDPIVEEVHRIRKPTRHGSISISMPSLATLWSGRIGVNSTLSMGCRANLVRRSNVRLERPPEEA